MKARCSLELAFWSPSTSYQGQNWLDFWGPIYQIVCISPLLPKWAKKDFWSVYLAGLCFMTWREGSFTTRTGDGKVLSWIFQCKRIVVRYTLQRFGRQSPERKMGGTEAFSNGAPATHSVSIGSFDFGPPGGWQKLVAAAALTRSCPSKFKIDTSKVAWKTCVPKACDNCEGRKAEFLATCLKHTWESPPKSTVRAWGCVEPSGQSTSNVVLLSFIAVGCRRTWGHWFGLIFKGDVRCMCRLRFAIGFANQMVNFVQMPHWQKESLWSQIAASCMWAGSQSSSVCHMPTKLKICCAVDRHQNQEDRAIWWQFFQHEARHYKIGGCLEPYTSE